MSEENYLSNKIKERGGKPLHLTFVGKPGVGKLAIIHALKRSTRSNSSSNPQALKLDLVQSKTNDGVVFEPGAAVVWVVDLFYLTNSNERILADFRPLDLCCLAVIVTKVGHVAAKEQPEQLQKERRDSIRTLVRTRCEELIRILHVPIISYSETDSTPACDEQLLRALLTLL